MPLKAVPTDEGYVIQVVSKNNQKRRYRVVHSALLSDLSAEAVRQVVADYRRALVPVIVDGGS